MNSIASWVQASRLASQSYIFFPLLLGQGWHYRTTGRLDPALLALAHLYGLFIQLYIVYANDYADQETDRVNTTFNMFSGGSRVLVEGRMTKAALKAGIIATVLLLSLTGVLLTAAARPLSLFFIAVSLGLLWLYSYAPARVSYRGGGEFLQMLGVGAVLPIFGYYVQAGALGGFPWRFLLFILPLQLACAMATALPDHPSDLLSGKHTVAVLIGPAATKKIIILLNVLSMLLCIVVPDAPAGYCIAPTLLCSGCMLFLLPSSEPGTRRLNLFVTCAVASTVLLMALSALALFFLRSTT